MLRCTASYGLLLTLTLLFLSDPLAAEDQIRLKSGRSLYGKIVEESKEEVVLELPGVGRLTLSRSEIDEILRDVKRGTPDVEPAKGGLLRSEHFFVWSGNRGLGTRILVVRKLASGGLQLEEDSIFTDEKGELDARIRIVEKVTESLEPVEITYSETSVRGGHLLRGIVKGEKLEVTISLPGERKSASFLLPDGVRFPLSAREFAIRERTRLESHKIPIFDPREETFYEYEFKSLGARPESWEGANTTVDVITRKRGRRVPEEIWLDPASRCLTEELNGPEVVAVLSTRERVKAYREGADVAASPEEESVRPWSLHADAGFKLRKPSLSWTFKRGDRGNRKVLTISNLRYFAYVDIHVLPDRPEGGLLSSLAVQMEKRHAGISEGFKKISDGFTEVGGEKAVRILASSRNKGEELRSLLVGLYHGDETWLISMAAPTKYFEGALPEFESILRSFEFLD